MRHARGGLAARPGPLDRYDRRRPGDDRRHDRVGSPPRQARREPAAAREARGPAHDGGDERRRGREARGRVRADLLHHRHDPLSRDRARPRRSWSSPTASPSTRAPTSGTIRDNVVVMITPIVEVDGRDRQVDIYNWHLAHPNDNWPPLVYWGHYVAHDNNRDAMGLSLALSRNVLKTYLAEKVAGPPRPPRVRSLSLRQHGRRRAVQRLARPDPDQRVADARLEQRRRDDEVRNAGRLHARQLRHLDARLPHVHGGDAQRDLAPLRDLRQRRRGHGRAHAQTRRVLAQLVPAEPAAAEGEVVAAQQQQLRADGPARLAPLRLGERKAAPRATST